MTNTARVSGVASGGQTSRVDRPVSLDASFNPWDDSWGDSWGDTWRVTRTLNELNLTPRVQGAAGGGQTKRVTI